MCCAAVRHLCYVSKGLICKGMAAVAGCEAFVGVAYWHALQVLLNWPSF
jgi:hypothetical protein